MSLPNKDMPAMPTDDIYLGFDEDTLQEIRKESKGLTKREMFAMYAMSNLKLGDYLNAEDLAHDAVLIADTVLKELDK